MTIINEFGMPFNDTGGDRLYSAGDWQKYFSSIVSNGVVGDVENELKVIQQAVPNKSILIDTGAVIINGVIRVVTSRITLSLADNTTGNTRIDRVVARLNLTDRKIEFVVKQGAAAAPALTRNENIYELSLAKVTLANGYSTITTSNITDERTDESVCGYGKTIYMQRFDDENNLLKYNRNVTATDAKGYITEVQYKRPSNNYLFLKRSYSNPNANGFYQTIVEMFYLADGVTVYKTYTYTLTYFSNRTISSMTRVVS